MFSYEIIQSFNNLEMLIYTYVMEHKSEVQYMTVRELSDAVHVSTSTIIRFCKKSGCEGWAEFRVQFKLYLKEEKNNKGKMAADNNLDELTYFMRMVTSTQYEQELQKAENLLREAGRIIFIGIGTSGILGKYGARYFSNMGKYSQYIEDPYYPVIADMEDTVVIVLSESGETQEIVNFADRLREHKCRLLTITNGASCTLAKMADCSLAYYVPEYRMKGEYNVTTQVPVLYLLELLGRRSFQ
ncbi:MAG: MurR/RpiR family transcriptional regulator [Clostridiales bacterium]|nr:MurR/RpiR family transcriptional regulator [Clostridiales bacterium]